MWFCAKLNFNCFLIVKLSEKEMSMLEERIKRSAKKTPPPSTKQERPQREQPTNPTATFLRKPAQEEVPNKLKYVLLGLCTFHQVMHS